MPANTKTADAKAEEAAVETPAEEVAPKTETVKPSEKDVLYRGNATVRRITVEDWASLEIEGEHREWTMPGAYRLPAESFSAAELRYLKSDGGFTLVDKVVEEE